MASEELKGLLNDAIAREIGVSVQYMWQHVMAYGLKSPEIQDRLKEVGIEEMKHAERIAERLNYFGGVPTTKPTKIEVGGDLKKMIQDNIKAEKEAIALYKKIIKKADSEGDTTTRLMFEEILADEEEHDDLFTTLLEGE